MKFRLPQMLVLIALLAPIGLAEAAASSPDTHATTQPGVIPFTSADVRRCDPGSYCISWEATGVSAVAVYAGTSADRVGRVRRVGAGGARGNAVVTGLADSKRWYFELVPDRGAPLVVADRSLHLETAPNFRDVGGYRTADGRWVRMGVLYRSDQLDLLSDADLERIEQLAPGLIVDLRTERERQRGADRTPPAARRAVADVYADADQSSGSDPFAAIATADDAVALLMTANRRFVSLESARRGYGLLLRGVAESSDPVVYHCTAGKDRTGWGTAVLLTILGVPRETVMKDYLSSNVYLIEKNRARAARMGADAERLDPVFWVRPEYLESAFSEVESDYGSFTRYLREGLGLDDLVIEALRTRYLVGAAAP
jgi:protein-tyrosine phosphatase